MRRELNNLLDADNATDLEAVMSTIMRLLQFADGTALTSKDAWGNTPIHYAMDFRLCHIPKSYRYEDIIRLLWNKLRNEANHPMRNAEVLFNKSQRSPYRFYFRVKDAVEAKMSRIKAAEPSVKESKLKEKEKTKEEGRDQKKTGGKPEAGGGLPSVVPHSKVNLPSAPRGNSKLVREPQHHPAPSMTPTTSEQKLNLDGLKIASLARRPTSVDKITEAAQDSVVLESAKPRSSGKPEGPGLEGSMKNAPWLWPERKKAAAGILEFVKGFIIRYCSDRDARDLLYGKIASRTNLFFDASHLRGRRVDDVVRLIENISIAGGFEDILSYVKIPQLVLEAQGIPRSQQRPNVANEKRHMRRNVIDKEGQGRDSLVKVFDKLAEVKVRKIIRLQVEDNGDEWPHTDTAIERAIKGQSHYWDEFTRTGLDIKEWDWCKPDINLDVIRYSAPMAEHIHLHWSGNQTVLYGWASNENGIPLISKRAQSLLSQITLHAYQGLESLARNEAVIKHFQDLIDERTHGRVKVTPRLLPRTAIISPRTEDPLLGEQSERPKSHAWIESMERFRSALMSMHHSGILNKPERVKVALIDDGIDLDEFNTYNNTVCYSGVSYCSGHGRDENAWWTSTDGHGTIMGNTITRINPWVVLDVIKLQSNLSYIHGEGARSIDPKSAADAIDAAVTHEDDIISMSWTITSRDSRRSIIPKEPPEAETGKKQAEQSGLDLLKTAIQEAVKEDPVKGHQRLLICSAADDLKLGGDNTFPYGAAPGRMSRIGSAGPMAERDPGSGSGGSITYYLPGNQVAEEQRAHSAKPVVYHNGSSVSTALATGLASLIMYCCLCLHSAGAGDKYKRLAEALRNYDNMKKAFNSINRYADEWKEDEKIVPVWGVFDNKTSALEKAGSGQAKIEVLKDLVGSLCHAIE
ncbi:hypothetical protein BJY04DRAFT_223305 [Aspergillus karnatakaensis]|uniref:S8 family peptidase n=1 Tax=Aspergillus karnatakaensis TaxID=1810916 RepID=UPI003CCE0389